MGSGLDEEGVGHGYFEYDRVCQGMHCRRSRAQECHALGMEVEMDQNPVPESAEILMVFG